MASNLYPHSANFKVPQADCQSSNNGSLEFLSFHISFLNLLSFHNFLNPLTFINCINNFDSSISVLEGEERRESSWEGEMGGEGRGKERKKEKEKGKGKEGRRKDFRLHVPLQKMESES